MPQVQLNNLSSYVEVEVIQEIAQVTVDDTGAVPVVDISVDATPDVVEVGVIGPQGPQGPQGIQGAPGTSLLSALNDVNVTAKVNNSVLYYDQTVDKFVANDINTITTLTDGGNF